MDRDIYQDLQVHLDALPIGFPKTASGVDKKLLKYLYTEEEAAVALRMSLFPMPVAKIAKKLRGTAIGKVDLESLLEQMYKKGTLLKYDTHAPNKAYGLAMFVIGSYEYQAGRMNKEFAQHVEDFFDEGFGHELNRTKIPQMRTIPIHQSLTVENHVMAYDRAEELVKQQTGTFAVGKCVCREKKDLLGQKCSRTDHRELCLLFGHIADHWIDIGTARKITKEESLEILKYAQQTGLVLQPSNTKDPKGICCCCGCCCGLLTTAKQRPKPIEVFATNFYATLDTQSCIGCKRCVSACHMDAIKYADKKCTIDLDRCIGCGACVPTCKKGSIKLKERAQVRVPYDSFKDLYLHMIRKKFGFFGKVKFMMKYLF